MRRVATLRTRLRGFSRADTSSEREGYASPGEYPVLETATRGNADYARLALSRGGDMWICTRSSSTSYASIASVAPPPPAPRVSFVDDPMAIDEHALTSLFGAFHEYSYDLDEGHYPWPLPTARVPLAPPRQNNCCTFVEALVAKAYANANVPGFVWDARRHGQMMVDSDDDYFSPVTAVVDSGIAVPAPSPDASPHPWTVIQGWRRMWRQGHTFIVVDHHAPTDRVLLLESNAAYGLNGPGYRELGALRLHAGGAGGAPVAPTKWWENEASWTWTRVCSTYRFRQHAYLKVKNRVLAAMPQA